MNSFLQWMALTAYSKVSLGGKKGENQSSVANFAKCLFSSIPATLYEAELATLNERMEGGEAKQEVEKQGGMIVFPANFGS